MEQNYIITNWLKLTPTSKNAKIILEPKNTLGKPKMTKLPLKPQKKKTHTHTHTWNLKNDQNTHVTSKLPKIP